MVLIIIMVIFWFTKMVVLCLKLLLAMAFMKVLYVFLIITI